jgi:hypothetical protein
MSKQLALEGRGGLASQPRWAAKLAWHSAVLRQYYAAAHEGILLQLFSPKHSNTNRSENPANFLSINKLLKYII